jgi:glycosyltransferase involved in cell wall biosynthesis
MGAYTCPIDGKSGHTMTKKHTNWIDLTDIISWSGHLTGTQRVVYELSTRLAEQTDNTQFFAYSSEGRYFYELPKSTLDRLVQSDSPTTNTTNSINTKSHKIKALLLSTYRQHIPYQIRQRLSTNNKQQILRVARKANHFRNRILHSLNNPGPIKTSGPQTVSFHKGDNVILLGKPWDTPKIIDDLRVLKSRDNFTLTHLVYDLIPVFLPHVFGDPLPQVFCNYIFEAVAQSDKLVAISNSTKKDIQRFCSEMRLKVPPIEVIRLGDNTTIPSSEASRPKTVTESGFILCVGTVEIRKNHILLYTAYKEMLVRGIVPPKLVIVGNTGWYVGDVCYEFARDPELKDLVQILNNVTDSEISWLYSNCLFTVYPSVYEGWGLPIAESLAYGKVCIASNTSSMTEIAGSLVEYFSPYNSGECVDLISKYMSIDNIKKKEQEIEKSYKCFSWDDAFKSFVVSASIILDTNKHTHK